MATEQEITDLFLEMQRIHVEINNLVHALGAIREFELEDGTKKIPNNPFKFRTFNQAERNQVFGDVTSELARIKASL